MDKEEENVGLFEKYTTLYLRQVMLRVTVGIPFSILSFWFTRFFDNLEAKIITAVVIYFFIFAIKWAIDVRDEKEKEIKRVWKDEIKKR